MIKITSFLLVATTLLAGCSASAPELEPIPAVATDEAPIIGGVAADSAALDAVGSLVTVSRYSGSTTPPYYGTPFCTATLISERQVLTAEHCLRNLPSSQEIGFAIGADGRRPKRVVSFVGTEVARASTGGKLGLGADVAVLHLETPIKDVAPLAVGELSAEDIGKRFVGIGYGTQDTQGTANTRRAGSMTLKALSGRVLEAAFGSFEGFKEIAATSDDFRWQVGDVSTPDGEQRARALYDGEVLLEGRELFVGGQTGDAQSCHGDSGGPLIRTVNGVRTTYGVTSWGYHQFGSFCAYGAVYALLGEEAKATITKALAWQDPCEGLTTQGSCTGDVATRCSSRVEGDRRPLVTDCAELGQACGRGSDGQVACIATK